MWYRCNISLLELTPEQFAVAVRRHWAIENSFDSGCGDELGCLSDIGLYMVHGAKHVASEN